jgi:putative membrane protein
MLIAALPYCGAVPLPGTLPGRFNADPVLIATLILAASVQWWRGGTLPHRQRGKAALGWVVAATAFISPLCALSVALFSARVGQHMVLILIAAPLIARGMPVGTQRFHWPIWVSALSFFCALWFWHMPVPYEATFGSVPVYWCMHLCLFGTAIWLWKELLHSSRVRMPGAIVAGILTCMHMGLLGAILSLADHALFRWHSSTTWAWGLTPLEDQQLGGVIMWVPGIGLFLWVAMRSVAHLCSTLGEEKAA